MMTKTLSKTLMTASLLVALGAAGVAPAMASGSAMQRDTDTSMGTKVSDTWITTKVKSEFATTKGVSAADTSVNTKDGVVMLSGTVASEAQKQMAITSARSVKGVKAVQADNLIVANNGDSMTHHSMSSDSDHDMSSDTNLATKASDTWITTKVKSEFATTKGVNVTDVSVDTRAGVVMLTGTVGSEAEKQMAIKSARSIKGVKAVEAGKLMIGKSGM